MDADRTRRRILLADDDEGFLYMLGRALGDAGFEAVPARSAAEAVAAVRAARPDLAILDVRMPGMSGLELADVLHSEYRVPFIFLSAVEDETSVRKAGTLGALAYVMKSMDVRSVIPTVETALARAAEFRKLQETEARRLRQVAGYDHLTGLPNRSLFPRRLADALGAATAEQSKLALLFIDLDRLKLINDTLGTEAGDQIIESVAQRLAMCTRSSDGIARVGADEFTVIVERIGSREAASGLAERVLESLATPIEIGGRRIVPTASVGIAIFPDDADNGDTLLTYADMAMSRAKQRGGNAYHFFTRNLETGFRERLDLEQRLRNALYSNELRLHYQPIYSLATGAIEAVEALVRWFPPGEPMIVPDRFIPVAEQTGLIVPLGEWVARTACAQVKAWQAQGWRELRVAVNVSARQLKEPAIAERFGTILRETALAPSHLTLELTEGIFFEDVESTRAALEALNALGVEISLDDFGTGYSSLGYLKRLPIDQLKIDRSFVSDLSDNNDDAAIVSAILAMARALGLSVVAEGVENADQLAFLKARSCTFVQGHLFSSPVPAEEVPTLLSGPDRPPVAARKIHGRHHRSA